MRTYLKSGYVSDEAHAEAFGKRMLKVFKNRGEKVKRENGFLLQKMSLKL